MSGTITAVYEEGVLRPLKPLSLPEHARVEIRIIEHTLNAEQERSQVRQILIEAGLIQPHPKTESVQPVSEADLTAATQALGKAGPLSDLIISEREGR